MLVQAPKRLIGNAMVWLVKIKYLLLDTVEVRVEKAILIQVPKRRILGNSVSHKNKRIVEY